MENEALRILDNKVQIVGTLKSKDLEVKTSKKGNVYMTGNVVVLSKFDNKAQEIKVSVFMMEKSKLFKGIETVKNEYKTIEKDGAANADRIEINGELTLNEYYNSQGNLIQFNQVKGIFFNRLDESNDKPDKAIATIDTVIQDFEPVMKDQLPTGDYKVKGFTVGWGNEVIELQNTIVGKDLAETFMDLYQPGSTGELTFKLNNYAVVKESAPEVKASHGFGSTEKVEARTVTDHVNNIEVIGGEIPYFGSKEYQLEEIERAKEVRELKKQELAQSASDTPPSGFGTNGNESQELPEGSLPSGLESTPNDVPFDDDMPDF
jgi:hypothetical protein